MNTEEIFLKLDTHAFYKGLIPSLSGYPQASGKCLFHDDQRASFSVNFDKKGGPWTCHAGCGSGNAIDFKMRLDGIDFPAAIKELAEIAEVTKGGGKREKAIYNYKDEQGNLLYQVVRYEPKDFRPRHKGPNGKWVYNLRDVRRVPYNLPELLSAQNVIIVEGEKDADKLRALGYTGDIAVTTTNGGAKAWKQEYAEFFKNKLVYIIPDHDHAGHEYAKAVARSLQGKASVIKLVELSDLGEIKGKHGPDVSDWLANRRRSGRTDGDIKDELSQLIKETSAWEPVENDVTSPSEWPEPLPLIEELKHLLYPIDALPQTIKEAVEEVQAFVQAPVPLIAGSALTAVSLAAQAHVDVE